jgi:hypothetical protein
MRPLDTALRSGHRLFQGPSSQKQFLSNPKNKPIPTSRLAALLFAALTLPAFAQAATTQSLAGTWQVRLDPEARQVETQIIEEAACSVSAYGL